MLKGLPQSLIKINLKTYKRGISRETIKSICSGQLHPALAKKKIIDKVLVLFRTALSGTGFAVPLFLAYCVMSTLSLLNFFFHLKTLCTWPPICNIFNLVKSFVQNTEVL